MFLCIISIFVILIVSHFGFESIHYKREGVKILALSNIDYLCTGNQQQRSGILVTCFTNIDKHQTRNQRVIHNAKLVNKEYD